MTIFTVAENTEKIRAVTVGGGAQESGDFSAWKKTVHSPDKAVAVFVFLRYHRDRTAGSISAKIYDSHHTKVVRKAKARPLLTFPAPVSTY